MTAEESEQEVTPEEVDDAYQSAEQLGAELVTLSLLPESRWKSLLHLDVIKVSLGDIMQIGRKPLPHRFNQRRGKRARTFIAALFIIRQLNATMCIITGVANEQTFVFAEEK